MRRASARQLLEEARLFPQEPMARIALAARLRAPYRRRQFHSFGDGSIIDKPSWLYGTSSIAIGDHVVILEGVWLSAERETWHRDEPAIRIGSGGIIRPRVVISARSSIVIEENVGIGGGVSIIDSDHTVSVDRNVLNNPATSTPIHIGAGAWIGDGVMILRGSRIGKACVIGANSVVRGEIPDFSVAVGAPARVVGRTDAGPENED
jgi:acetyltransferase-like isoleucine patch superfamily enzyme